MPSADADSSNSVPTTVSTAYSWKNGHTVNEEGKRVIPLIDIRKANSTDPQEKAEFFKLLRYAVTEVGFLYLQHAPGLDKGFVDKVIEQCHLFFAQPDEDKAAIHMSKSKFFRGWTKLGDERTQYQANLRENLDLGFELEPVKEDEVFGNTWRKLFIGPNQWPDETKFPEFRPTLLTYIEKTYEAQMLLTRLILKIFDLPENTLDRYFTFPATISEPQPFCLCKIAYYPKVDVTDELRAKIPTLFDQDGFLQGCGPHKDNSAMMTVLCQDEGGLEVQGHGGV